MTKGIKTLICSGCAETTSYRTNHLGSTEELIEDKCYICNKKELLTDWIIDDTDDVKNFIFDSDKLIKKKVFVIDKLNKDTLDFGLLLPKEKATVDKKGKKIGKTQEDTPALITSDFKLIDGEYRLEDKYKIKFNSIPTNLNLRFSLESIHKYLNRNYKVPNKRELFNKIKKQYLKFLYFAKDHWYTIHTLWDMGTYFFILFKAYPILELRGLKRTAKTKIMNISSLITFNATEIMTNPSAPSLFRETHDKRPTKYIDECEKLIRFYKGGIELDDRIELINSSYYYKGTVPRVEKIGNKFVTIYYQVYSPTMIGSINGLYGATEDRAIVHITVKNPADDKRGDIEPDEEDLIWQEIRDDLYVFALTYWKDIENIYNNLKNDTKIKDRDFQIWKPLLSIAKFIDDDLFNEVKEFAEKLTKVKNFEGVSEGTREFHILKAIHNKLREGNSVILIKDIRNSYPEENKPTHKWIGMYIDKIGFMENRVHTREGNGFEISKEMFESIVKSICPLIFSSSSSHTSHTDDTQLKISEEKVKKVKENLENCEAMKQMKEMKQI